MFRKVIFYTKNNIGRLFEFFILQRLEKQTNNAAFNIGMFVYGWPLNIHIVNMINAFVDKGFSVNLFLKSTVLIASHFVAPNDNDASINSSGIVLKIKQNPLYSWL